MLAQIHQFQVPTVCHICGDSGEHHTPNLCMECYKDIPFIEPACECCALPLAYIGERRCNKCMQTRPIYDSCVSVVRYERPIDVLFNRLKHHRDITVAATFASLLADKILEEGSELPDLIIPVPLNWKRQLMRGFNQSQAIAVILSGKLGVNVDPKALARVTNSVPQQGLSRSERLKNLDRCFEANKSVRNKKVALIDDVVTTGATMQAAATALYIRGTASISAWSIARTPADQHLD